MKSFVVMVEVEFTCRDEAIAVDHVKHIPFGDNDCDFRIVSVCEGRLPPGTSLYELEPNLIDEQNDGGFVVRMASD
jgi:hypothetical protein